MPVMRGYGALFWWFIAMEEAIASLANFPERCPLAPETERSPLAPETERSPFEVRQLLYGRRPHAYRILFTIRGDVVHVLHIRHGRRLQIGEPH
jgi:hypothetical protein